MILDLKQFTSALAKVSALANGEKNVPGVLLDINEYSLNVCYSDGRKSVIEKMDAITGDKDILDKVVVNYQRLVDIINACQSSGRIVTNSLEVIFDSEKTLRIRAEKQIPEQESEDEEVSYKTVSIFEQSMSWEKAGSSLKTSILSRMNYGSIFESEQYDKWDIAEFKSLLDKVSSEKGRVSYISPKKECAFVSNMAYMSCIPLKGEYNYPMVFTTTVAKSISDILGKIQEQTEVYIHLTDRKYCCIHTEDNSVGIWVEMAEANQIHLTTLGRYQAKVYNRYQLTFIREVLKNVIDAAISSDKSDKTVLKFGESTLQEGEIELRITSNNTGASINNDYSVLSVECLDVNGDIGDLELPISLKVISDILNKCTTEYVGIDIDIDDSKSKCLRISEVDLEVKAEVFMNIRENLGLDMDEPISLEDRIEYRGLTLAGKHYTISSK